MRPSFKFVLRRVRKFRNATFIFVRLSVRMEQLGFHWTDFHEIFIKFDYTLITNLMH